ncbi:MAG: DUF4388 domain-containing protein [Acidobacteriota bacterium]
MAQNTYHGTLNETSLPEMLFTVYRNRVPGLIDIQREGITKRFYMHDGIILHASSSDRADRLGAHLYRTNQLTRKDLVETMRQREHSGKRYGQILIERGLLAPSELYHAIRAQMESIVLSVFSWREGELTFQIGEFSEPVIHTHLPMRQAILRGVKGIKDTKSLVARLGKKSTVFRPVYEVESLVEIALDRDEYGLLRLVDGERTLYDICAQGPFSVPENARLLYAFRVLQLIQRIEQPAPQGVKMRMAVTAGASAD